MTDTHSASVLRRKLAPCASPVPDQTGTGGGPARTLVRCFARAVSDCAPLMAEGGERTTRSLSLSELIDSVDPEAFVGLVTGEDGPPGLAIIDQTGFSALVEAMTIGRLSARDPSVRRATATDAALLAEVLNATLVRLDDGDPASGFVMRRPVPDNRLLPVLLDDLSYTLVSLDVTLISGDVRRPAQVALALPQRAEAVLDSDGTRGDRAAMPAAARATAGQEWTRALEASVMTAPAALQAELGRVTLPLADVLALGTGGMLTLPLSNLEEVRLVALDGTVHAMGRLGQSRGMRAVRLTTWPGAGPPEAVRFEQAVPPGETDPGVLVPARSDAHPQAPSVRPEAAIDGAADRPEPRG